LYNLSTFFIFAPSLTSVLKMIFR